MELLIKADVFKPQQTSARSPVQSDRCCGRGLITAALNGFKSAKLPTRPWRELSPRGKADEWGSCVARGENPFGAGTSLDQHRTSKLTQNIDAQSHRIIKVVEHLQDH